MALVTSQVSIGLDENHTLAVWNWRESILLVSTAVQQDKVVPICSSHSSRIGYLQVFVVGVNPIDESIVTAGVKHIRFWHLDAANQLESAK